MVLRFPSAWGLPCQWPLGSSTFTARVSVAMGRAETRPGMQESDGPAVRALSAPTVVHPFSHPSGSPTGKLALQMGPPLVWTDELGGSHLDVEGGGADG